MPTQIKPSVLANTAVTAGTYGGASVIPRYTVDAQGRITSAANVSISLTGVTIPGLAQSAYTDTTDAANVTSGILNIARLPTSNVTPIGVANTSVGHPASVPRLTVDAYGRVTSANSVAIAISASAITGLSTSATTDTTSATNITTGTLSAARLPSSGVTPGTYTSVTVDAYGRVVSGSSSVSIGAATTAVAGIVQLTDSISSSSTTTAATPNSVRVVADSRAAVNPGSPKNGDIQVSGSTVYIYASGWRQIYPATYS